MEPLTPNDPLWKLMSKARPVVPRPDFTQNVLRAARQQGQDTGWWPQISDWLAAWRRPLMVGAAAVAGVVLACLVPYQGAIPSAPVVAVAAVAPAPPAVDAAMAEIVEEDFSLPLDSLDHMDALVAMEDTSSLTDAEIQFLLY